MPRNKPAVTFVKRPAYTYVFVHRGEGAIRVLCDYCDKPQSVSVATAATILGDANNVIVCESCRQYITNLAVNVLQEFDSTNGN